MGTEIDDFWGPTERAQQSHHHEHQLLSLPAAGCVAPVSKASTLESSNQSKQAT